MIENFKDIFMREGVNDQPDNLQSTSLAISLSDADEAEIEAFFKKYSYFRKGIFFRSAIMFTIRQYN